MRSGILLCIFAAVLLLVFFSGCTANSQETSATAPDNLTDYKSLAESAYQLGNKDYMAGNYYSAAENYDEACKYYDKAGLFVNASEAERRSFASVRCFYEYPLNETEAEDALREKAAGITDGEIDSWLSGHAQKQVSDGNTLYFADTASNYLFENYELLQRINDPEEFDYFARYLTEDDVQESGSPYLSPVNYSGSEKFVILGDVFTAGGTVRIWFPLPVETDSQRDVRVENLSYSEYIKAGPVTDGQIGYVYYEIPAEEIEGDLVITADIGFRSYKQEFDVGPSEVLPYDKQSPEYLLYTKSGRNIEITDEIKSKAEEIVGDETNPYLQAIMIYDYIIQTYPYSHVPHLFLDTAEPKVSESSYMFKTGRGDCGTQSMLFSAMCRSLGIPARATGGYQMLLKETPGTHFWAEYYIEGYGWIPCDLTVADVADWYDISDERRAEFKEYYGHNLDSARYVIQKDVDAGMIPEIPDDAVAVRLARQTPAVIYDGYDLDVDGATEFLADLRAC
jgi:transglutaminase-like putative cysteine protease